MSASCHCCQGDQARVDASGRVRLDPDHRLACVSRVPIFRELSEADRRRIASRATTRLVPKGEVVQQQGGMPALQIVHSGQIKQSLLAEDGTQRLLRILGPGEFMGEHSVLTGRPAPRAGNAHARPAFPGAPRFPRDAPGALPRSGIADVGLLTVSPSSRFAPMRANIRLRVAEATNPGGGMD